LNKPAAAVMAEMSSSPETIAVSLSETYALKYW